jgi:hypothetical protein
LWIIRVPARQTGKAHANCYPGFPARRSQSYARAVLLIGELESVRVLEFLQEFLHPLSE